MSGFTKGRKRKPLRLGFQRGMQSKPVSELRGIEAPDPILAEIAEDFAAWYEGMRSMKAGLPALSELHGSKLWRVFSEYVKFAKAEVADERYIELAVKLKSAAITALELEELERLIAKSVETKRGAKLMLMESVGSAKEALRKRSGG